MNRDQLLRELRHYARKHDLVFELYKSKGKGSHYILTLGDKTTTVQSDINEQRAKRIKTQLGIPH
jgi:hypothetical protein